MIKSSIRKPGKIEKLFPFLTAAHENSNMLLAVCSLLYQALVGDGRSRKRKHRKGKF